MTSSGQPHLLNVHINSHGEVEYSIDCPVAGTSKDIRCALWEESTPSPAPEEPSVPEPHYIVEGGVKTYRSDSDIAAIEAWNAYYVQLDAYDDNEHNGWKRTSDCWVRFQVANLSVDDGWELKGFDKYLISGPIAVDWDNVGGIEDSYLVLMPYIPEEPGADAEAVHDKTNV